MAAPISFLSGGEVTRPVASSCYRRPDVTPRRLVDRRGLVGPETVRVRWSIGPETVGVRPSVGWLGLRVQIVVSVVQESFDFPGRVWRFCRFGF